VYVVAWRDVFRVIDPAATGNRVVAVCSTRDEADAFIANST